MSKKVQITMNITDHYEERALLRLLKADRAYCALHEIAQEIFRPARKHGYNDPALQEAMNNHDLEHEEIIEMLEKKFYEILSENEISLEEYV